MKQCNWCDETADHQSGNNGGGSSSAAKNRSPTEAIAIKGEGKIKCAHHQMASPLIGTGSTSSSNNSANGTSTPTAGFLPQAPAQLVKFAAGSSAAGPGIPSGGPSPSVDSLAALNMLPAHFRDMFLAAHLLRGKWDQLYVLANLRKSRSTNLNLMSFRLTRNSSHC